MRDCLEVAVRYYVHGARGRILPPVCGSLVTPSSSSTEAPGPGSRAGAREDLPAYAPYRRYIAAARAFLQEGLSIVRETRNQTEQATLAAIARHRAELDGRILEFQKLVSAASADLLSAARGGQPMQSELLLTLNTDIRRIEQHYGPLGVSNKSDVLPEPLLHAAPDSKLYPSLVKKLETLCGRTSAELEEREVARFRSSLAAGGLDTVADKQLADLTDVLAQRKARLFECYAEELSASDHLQVSELVPLSLAPEPLRLATWNVLEFPISGAAEPVLDGVRPVCDFLLRGLRQKDADSVSLVLDAFSSSAVINRHTMRVAAFLQDAMSQGTELVFLQEVGEDVRSTVVDLCRQRGWFVHVSAKNDDGLRADSMTAIVARRAFDEAVDVQVQRNKKCRNFAAVRFDQVWVVCCHLPLSGGPKEKEDLSMSHGSYFLKVLQQLWQRFSHDSCCAELVAGGDFNVPLRREFGIAEAHPPEGCSSITLHAPTHRTTLNDYMEEDPSPPSPIDGVIVLR